jgi:hypothetical protein
LSFVGFGTWFLKVFGFGFGIRIFFKTQIFLDFGLWFWTWFLQVFGFGFGAWFFFGSLGSGYGHGLKPKTQKYLGFKKNPKKYIH